MPDLTLSVALTRTLLSLADLDVNDHVNYYLSMHTPAMIAYQRNQVSSAYVDDDFTVNRRRGKVTDEVVWEVLSGAADTSAQMWTNMGALIAALKQDSFHLSVTADSHTITWGCEAADYQVVWSGPRLIAKQAQLHVQLPRSPVPLAGEF